MSETKHIIPHDYLVNKAYRSKFNEQKPMIVWLTGLSGSGKSTIANQLEIELGKLGKRTYLLDGDNVRTGLCKDLGFSEEDRNENIRRIGEVAKLMLDAGLIVISAFVSPFKADRQQVRTLVEDGEFFEVFVNCPVEVCEQRDTKGLYAKARKGEIANFTGISSPFEHPENPEVEVHTDREELSESVNKVLNLLQEKLKN
jgi:adenylylsulfate kinase